MTKPHQVAGNHHRQWAFTIAYALLTVLPTGRAAAVLFQDQQVQVIDHADYFNDYITVFNKSAFYFHDGAAAFALTHYTGWLEFSGGMLRQNLILYGTGEANIMGGEIRYNVYAYNKTTHWSGGTIRDSILARSNANFYVYGSGFRVDGEPVGYGALAASSGVLSGTLRSGEEISVRFMQGESTPMVDPVNTGTIVLIDGDPTPTPPPDLSDEIAVFNDGGSHVIDHADFSELRFGVSVRSPQATTTLTVAPGAVIGQGLNFSGPSVVHMTGGEVATAHSAYSSALNAYDSVFNLSGGLFQGWAIMRRGEVDISGGTISGDLEIASGSFLSMSGGSVGGQVRCSHRDPTRGGSTIAISGGHVGGNLVVFDFCRVQLSGGVIEGDIEVALAQLEIVGSSFAIDGAPVPFGIVTPSSGILTGTLESGDTLYNHFSINRSYPDSELILSVPEPSTALMRGISAIALFALHACHRRRSSAAAYSG